MAESKLMADLRAIPSWVWLGGAAIVGILFVLRSSSGSSAAASGTSATGGVPIGTPAVGSDAYGVQSAISNLQQIDQQILTSLQSTPSVGAITPVYWGGQPPAAPVQNAIQWSINTWKLPQGQFTAAFNTNPTANPTIYGYLNNQWVPINLATLNLMTSKTLGPPTNSQSTGQAGVYNGVQLPALP